MLKANGLPEQESDDYAGPGVMGFSKRLSQVTTPEPVDVLPARKVPNITQEELEEGQ